MQTHTDTHIHKGICHTHARTRPHTRMGSNPFNPSMDPHTEEQRLATEGKREKVDPPIPKRAHRGTT